MNYFIALTFYISRSRGGQGFQQDNRNNHQDNTRGYQGGGNRGGFSDGGRGGNRGGYDSRGGNQPGYQDNRTSQGGYDNNRRNSGGYQSQAAYQPPDLQHSQSFDTSNQSKGRYQNEHDDRSNSNYSRGGSAAGRGRSVYNRGGRNCQSVCSKLRYDPKRFVVLSQDGVEYYFLVKFITMICILSLARLVRNRLARLSLVKLDSDTSIT